MATKHPYVNGTGVLVQILDHLRRSFPQTLNAEVLKKLGFAPQNESYVINLLRFLNLINDDGSRTDRARQVFSHHELDAFQKEFAPLVQEAYGELFGLHGDGAWTLSQDKLITFFRQADQSIQGVGERQARTFKTLSSYVGHAEQATPTKPASNTRTVKKSAPSKEKPAAASLPDKPTSMISPQLGDNNNRNLGLTVRIEINLPATGDQETYDKIFKSIRDNLLNG